MRRVRRSRKTRYRECRFDNRKRKEGWLPPSIISKIEAHKRLIAEVHKILPISKVIIEVASFDIQKIKNPIIKGKEYRQGEMYGWENIRQYILFRDKYQCQAKKTCKNKNFEVNHIETRMTGGNAPNNLNLLCKEHHQDYTDGKLKKKFVRGESYKHQTFMNTMRWKLFKELKAIYPNISLTYGYITSIVRKANKLPKSHRNDALCIGGNPKVERLDNYLQIKQVRKKKRNLAEATFQKEHIRRKLNAKQIVRKEGLWCKWDKVKLDDKFGFISGFGGNDVYVKDINNDPLQQSPNCRTVNPSKLKLVNRNNNWTLLCEQM